jgi:chromosome segregation protein
LHITELRLAGFKSFVDQVRAPIEPGLTGVVGPNGCGKSNLLEAVRWVMGAASAKAMRADEMDDVIFAGSAGRPMREHAEVSLVLADAAGKAPGPLAKEDVLEITRRIRRAAGSTYRINGKEVRAKDVQLLFADAATGANSPALVRQGQVSELINAKPENRRRILEDAAGVAGLHARRHEADLKLRAADANLVRLDEILAEIEAQAASLKKQARQAERYRGLAQTLRETEALLLHRRWSEARAHQEEAEAALRAAERNVAEAAAAASAAQRGAEQARAGLDPLREEELIAAAALRRLEGVRVGLERDLAEAETAIARAEADLARAAEEGQRIDSMSADCTEAIARLAEESKALGPAEGIQAQAALAAAETSETKAAATRAEAEQKLETLASAAAAQRARAAAARLHLQRLDERVAAIQTQEQNLPADADLDSKLKAARESAANSERASAAAREHLRDAEAALKQAEKTDEAAWSAFRSAESAARELEAEVKALDKLSPPAGVKFPPVLASIEVAPGYERALAAALGEDLDASTHADAPTRWGGGETHKLNPPKGATPLAQHVKAPAALAARLALVWVVDADAGADLQSDCPPGVRLVSREGDLWRWDGFVRRADAPQPAAAKLEHKSRLAAARAELDAADQRLARIKETSEAARAARRAAEDTLRKLRAEAPALAAAAADGARECERLEAEQSRVRDRRTELTSELQTLVADRAEAQSGGEVETAPIDEIELAAARAAVEAARTAAAAASAERQSLLRDRAGRETRRAAIEAETKQWRARAEDCAKRKAALAKETKSLEAARANAAAAPETVRAALSKLMNEAGAAEARRAAAGDKVAAAETAARQAETAAREQEAAHASAREARAVAEARTQAGAERITDIAARAKEEIGCAPEELVGRAGNLASAALGAGPIHDIERRVERLRGERDAAGPVNLRAEEEFAEAKTRIETLSKEKADVAEAIAKLRRAITSLNNEGRARLLKAFDIVDTRFGQLFGALFEGGAATLKLTESDDPLNAGLEIYAQPPGKKLSALSLMSGGEQALTATALIFAVFMANPAPLCVLDEVDAPLDDANVERFCHLLDEMKKLTATRFIVITHNPLTMSRMDRLYGVTMPEQGVSQLVSVDLSRAQAMAASA